MWWEIRSSAIPMTGRQCSVGELQVNTESMRDKALLITDDRLHALVEIILMEHTPGATEHMPGTVPGGTEHILCTSCSQRWPCVEIVALHKWLG